MKRTPLRSALLALLATPALAVADPLQLYGRLNLGVENIRLHGAGGGNGADTRLSNYRSVFGVRGSEAIGNGLRVIFQVEGTLSPDTGAGGVAARDTRVGLEGTWARCSPVTGPRPTTPQPQASTPSIRPRPAT